MSGKLVVGTDKINMIYMILATEILKIKFF